MKFKNKLFKLFMSCAILLTLVPANNLLIKASDSEFVKLDDTSNKIQYTTGKDIDPIAEPDVETVVTTVDNVVVGTGINQFQFSNEWHNDVNDAAHGGTEHCANKGVGDPGAWATQPTITFKFKGNKAEFFGQKEITGGTFRAVIDGDEDKAVEFSSYNASKTPQTSLYFKDGLTEGEHTLTLTILKTFEATMGGTYASNKISGVIDYAKVTSLEEVDPDKTFETKVDSADKTTGNELFKYKYEGAGWADEAGYGQFYNGTDSYSNNSTATYSVKFIGSGVKIIASKNSGHADYDVFVDGVDVGDAISKLPEGSEAQHQQTIFEKSDIAYGTHTLKVAKKAGSTGAIQADAVVITHKAIAPTSIAFDKEALSIEAGLTGEVSVSMTPTYATGKIVYSIADTNVATISDEGEVTAIKEGTSTITATVKGTNVTASIPLTITPEGMPLAISVGNPNMLATQEQYDKILTQAKTTWSDVAWRGDVLYSKVDLASKKLINNVTIKASDFVNGNNVIAKSQIEINWLKETLANIGRGQASAPEKPFPDIIHKDASEKLTMAKKKVQSAWININVPKNAKPGTYTGTITVSADELDEDTVLNYTFEVLDIVQPEPQDMDTQVQIWQHPFSVANYYGVKEEDYFEEPHLKYMRKSMEEYASLGGKDVVANIVNEAWGHQSYYGDPTMVTWIKKSDGTMSFDYDWFDKWINFNIESGVLDPAKGIGQIKCFSIVPWDDSFTYFDEATGKTVKVPASAGSEYWTSMWTSFLTNFMEHVEKKGWFDITYIALDERPIERVGPAVDLIKSIKNKDGIAFKSSSAFNYSSGNDYTFLDKIDDISIGLSHVNNDSDDMKKMAEHRKEKGLLTTIYTCTGDYPGNYIISEPADNAWCMWYTMNQNTDGYMKWAWDNWVPDPLTNVNYKYWEPGDGWFIYPTEKGVESDDYFYKTPRYEMLKQGTRDINKAKYIMENSETLSNDVDALVKSLKRPAKKTSYGSAVPATEADRALPGTEVERMRKGINDLSRQYIADNPDVAVTDISLDKTEVTLDEGQQVTVVATITPENATDKTLTWKSSNKEVATVKDGVITAVKAGTATITVKNEASGVAKNVSVTVNGKEILVTDISVDLESVTLEEGGSVTVVATATPQNATDKALTWKSSSEEVATVNDGLITAVKAGTATITVKNDASGVTKNITVTVNIKTLPEDQITIKNPEGTVEVSGKIPNTVTLVTTVLNEKEEKELTRKATEKNKAYFAKNMIETILGIKLLDGNVEYHPNGEVTVKIKLDNELLGKKLKIIYISDDGTIEELISSIENGYIIFKTSHFSKFAIVSERVVPIFNVGTDIKTTATGDSANVVGWMMLTIIAGGILVSLKKRHQKSN